MHRFPRLVVTSLLLLATCALAAPATAKKKPPKKPTKVEKTEKPPERPEAPDEPASTAVEGTKAEPATAKPGEASKLGDPVAKPAEPKPAEAKPGDAKPSDAPKSGSKEEEVTDFDAEEKKMDERIGGPNMPPAQEAAGPPGRNGASASTVGYKLIVDLLLWHTFGTKQISFFPNHTLAILMLQVSERVSLQLHIAPDPAFYELAFVVTPTFLVKVGKMLVPFGTSNFHHLIGGRVDQQSQFLPETWGDYGIGVNHLVVDTRYVSVEYDAYVVNGFGGTDAPLIGNGTVTDNNFGKGLGARVIVGLPKGIRLIGSVFHSLWDVNNSKSALYYAAGASMPVGAINLPVLNRIGLRGEWARGELQYPDDNIQRGLTPHAVAKAGWYTELTVRLFDIAALRLRAGRINPNNTVTDDSDVELLETALVIGSPKLAFIGAWQATKNPNKRYSPTGPPDVLYAKVFLQY